MKEKSLRLRLVVRRHGLPEVRVLFNVPLDHDPTIAKLVELVNDAIPLEAGDWGLEDYAVELHDADGHAFECLHYQSIAGVLEKDDEVFIRPLFSEDLKKRRISGRFQITSDGRHLIDGVPYGRPLLKRPLARPAVHIAPRKKRRLLHDDQLPLFRDDEDDAEPLLLTQYGEVGRSRNQSGVKLRARFADTDEIEGNGGDEDEDGDYEDEDDDYEDEDALDGEKQADVESGTSDTEGDTGEVDGDSEPADAGSPIGNDELKGLREDIAGIYDADERDPGGDGDAARPDQDQLGLSNMDKITALRAAFPSANARRCEKALRGCGGSTSLAYRKLAKSHNARLDPEGLVHFCNALRASAATDGSDDENEERTGSEADSIVRHFDKHGFPPGSIQAGTALSYMAQARQWGEDILPRPTKLDLHDHTDESATRSASPGLGRQHDGSGDGADATSSSGSSSESGSNSASDDADDGSGSGSDEDDCAEDESGSKSGGTGSDDSSPEEASAKQTEPKADSDTSSSGGDSSGDDFDSGDSGKKSLAAGPNDKKGRYVNSSGSDDSSSGNDTDSEACGVEQTSLVKPPRPIMAPAQVSKQEATAQPPSQASADAETMTEYAVPPGRGLSRTQKRNARRKARKLIERATKQSGDEPTARHGGINAVNLDALKQRLLEKAGLSPSATEPEGVTMRSVETIVQPERVAGQHLSESTRPASGIPDHGVAAASPTEATAGLSSGATTPRRARLDLGAGRRMLFGALGIRNPKTKEDEDAIRAKLMTDVRSHTNPRVTEAQAGTTGSANDAQADARNDKGHDTWQEKIVYRAVECCHEGVDLSEPPFPFVQRWDAQQQGRNGKRKQQDQGQFDNDNDQSDQHNNKKLRISAKNSQRGLDHAVASEIELNYDDTEPAPREESAGEKGQLADVEDLPSLPNDISTLPPLHLGDVKPGMVITWRNWLLSKATNWQPQVSNLTAVVTKVHNDNVSLELLLARRDRCLDRNEKVYDADGKRVYDRFEAPDLDEEDGVDIGGEGERNDETGYRTLDFAELEDPRIVQAQVDGVAQEAASVVAGSAPADGHGIETARSPTAHSARHYAASLKKCSDEGSDKTAGGAPPGAAGDYPASCGSIAPENGPVTEEIHNSPQPRSDMPSSRVTLVVPVEQDGIDGLGMDAGDAPAHGAAPATSTRSPRLGSGSPTRQLDEGVSNAGISSQASGRLPRGSHPLACEKAATTSEPIRDEPSREHCCESACGTPAVEYPNLNPPASSASSVRSGRQLNDDYSIDLGNDTFAGFDDTIDAFAPSDETPMQKDPAVKRSDRDGLDHPSQHTPAKILKPSSPAFTGSSSSSIPSLDDIFFTASTSRKRRSPSASELWSTIKRRGYMAVRDEEDDTKMLELNQTDESQEERDNRDLSTPVNKIKVPSTTQYSSNHVEADVKPNIKTFDASVSPPVKARAKRAKKQAGTSQFSIPGGSQVIDLEGSSPEPEFSEHYAEDSLDETYSEAKGLPRGDEWMQKLTRKSRRPKRVPRLPASSAVSTRDTGTRKTASQAHKTKTGIKP